MSCETISKRTSYTDVGSHSSSTINPANFGNFGRISQNTPYKINMVKEEAVIRCSTLDFTLLDAMSRLDRALNRNTGLS